VVIQIIEKTDQKREDEKKTETIEMPEAIRERTIKKTRG
jgi:hypothetical protein